MQKNFMCRAALYCATVVLLMAAGSGCGPKEDASTAPATSASSPAAPGGVAAPKATPDPRAEVPPPGPPRK